jgi:hypothetical protein
MNVESGTWKVVGTSEISKDGKTTLYFLPSTFGKRGGFHEEEKQDESIKSSA